MDPVTDVCVVEEAKNAPAGYCVIELTDRTFSLTMSVSWSVDAGDTGQDADLWKDKGLFFGRKETRYLCFARKFSLDCVESLSVQVTPPPNVLTISLTRDTGQKCLRKRHLCYTVIGRDIRNSSVVSDIGVFSKNIPDGFMLAGELNGFLIAYKTIKINVEPDRASNLGSQRDEQVAFGATRGSIGDVGCLSASARNWIDDIPYRLNPMLLPATRLPVIHLKTASQIYSQYNYDFSFEREVLRTMTSQESSGGPASRRDCNGGTETSFFLPSSGPSLTAERRAKELGQTS